jgi:hypothetical protein
MDAILGHPTLLSLLPGTLRPKRTVPLMYCSYRAPFPTGCRLLPTCWPQDGPPLNITTATAVRRPPPLPRRPPQCDAPLLAADRAAAGAAHATHRADGAKGGAHGLGVPIALLGPRGP